MPTAFEILLGTLAGAWCGTVIYRDLTARLLPNWLTLGGAAAALLLKLLFQGAGAAVLALLGGVVAGLFLLIPFFLKAAGGGDVKLLFAAGVFVGWPQVLAAVFWVSVVGFCFGLVRLLTTGAFLKHAKHVLMTLTNPFYDRKAAKAQLPSLAKVRMSFGTPIVMGAMLSFVLPL